MTYKLNITKLEPNPEYEQQLKDYRENERYRGQWNQQDKPFPAAQLTVQVLDVEVTEAAFQAIRRACIEVI